MALSFMSKPGGAICEFWRNLAVDDWGRLPKRYYEGNNVAKVPRLCVPPYRRRLRAAISRHARRPWSSSGHRWKALELRFPTVPGWASEASCTSSYGHLKLTAGREGHSILVPSLYYSILYERAFYNDKQMSAMDPPRREHSNGPKMIENNSMHQNLRTLYGTYVFF